MSELKLLEKVAASWRWVVFLLFAILVTTVIVQPWQGKVQDAPGQTEGSTQLSPEASVESPTDLVRRVSAEVPGMAPPASDSSQAEAMLTLVSDTGIPIEAVWVRIGGEWKIERLESSGQLALGLIIGADLIAPVGHLPERPNDSPSQMQFSPWSMVEIRGVPEEWFGEAVASVPSQPLQEDFWQFGSFGDSGNKTWSCVLQPLVYLMDEPNLQLDTWPFSLEISGPHGIFLNVELSLVRGTRLTLDYQSLAEWVETVDVPISFLEGGPSTSWEVTVLEDGAGQSTLPSPVLINQKAGVIAHRVSRKRVLKFGNGEQPVIQGVKVGSSLTVFAKADDSTWYSFQSRFVVGKNPEVVLLLENGFHVEVTGLSHFGEKVDKLGLEWKFDEFDGERYSSQTIRASKVISSTGNDGSIRFVPTMGQMWRLSKIGLNSLWIHLVVSNGPLFTSAHHVQVPLSRQLQIEIPDLESNGFAMKVGKSPSALAGAKWVAFAIDHKPHQSNDWCNAWASVASIEESDTPGESVLWLVDSDGGPLSQMLIDEMPKLFSLDWPDRSEFYEQGTAGVFRELETRSLEIDFSSSTGSGSWKVSWCFGCERTNFYPLSFPLTTEVLPKRVKLEVPLRHAHLLVNGQRIRNLDVAGPIAQQLE